MIIPLSVTISRKDDESFREAFPFSEVIQPDAPFEATFTMLDTEKLQTRDYTFHSMRSVVHEPYQQHGTVQVRALHDPAHLRRVRDELNKLLGEEEREYELKWLVQQIRGGYSASDTSTDDEGDPNGWERLERSAGTGDFVVVPSTPRLRSLLGGDLPSLTKVEREGLAEKHWREAAEAFVSEHCHATPGSEEYQMLVEKAMGKR